MFKNTLFIVLFSLVISSCSSTKKATKAKRTHRKTTAVADRIVRNAVAYKGTRYKYGGTSKSGMDCSGLVYVAFKKEGISIHRVSSAMAAKGKNVSLKKVKRGDLLFFRTTRKRKITHVGLVTSVKKGVVYFIHATTKRGVKVSSLSEKYWKKAFVKAKRVL